MSKKTALAFPATLIEALRFSERSRTAGWRVVGAASVPASEVEAAYDAWIELPYIYDKGFCDALAAAVAQEGISRIFSSHETVSRYLSRTLPDLCPGVEFETVERQEADAAFHKLVAESFTAYSALARELGNASLLRELEHLAVLQRAFQMRGESGMHKLSALMAVLGSAPAGDVIEIGALSGRSAFVLGWLARRYGTGAVLCIDPWTNTEAVQRDAPELLQKSSLEMDFSTLLNEFRLNLIPSFYGTFNYVQAVASAVRPGYKDGFRVGPTEFGSTKYSGKIAVLHIDGNHDFAAVSADVNLWWQSVVPNGWIIVDDYVWPFGDGPKRAADTLMARHPGAFQRAFVNDEALFLQRASGQAS